MKRYLVWTDVAAGCVTGLLPGFLTHWLYPLLNLSSFVLAAAFFTAAYLLKKEDKRARFCHLLTAGIALFKGTVLVVLLLDAFRSVWGLYGSLGQVIGLVQVAGAIAVLIVYFPYPLLLLSRCCRDNGCQAG